MLIDIHCHLDLLEDIDDKVEQAISAGVKQIITNGTSPSNNRDIIDLAKKYSIVDPALGLYPHDAVVLSKQEVAAELEFIKSQRPIAIGEVGLDYHYPCDDPDWMRHIFKQVLQVAQDIARPVIVHSRKAEADVIEIVSDFDVKVDLHCFGGSLKLAKKGLDAGCYFSIPPIIVRSTHFQRLVEELPLSRILSETDSPYLSADEGPNQPAQVKIVAREIARIKGMTEVEVINQLWMNAKSFLR